MRPLTVLITNYIVAGRTGTEIVVRDLALGLKARGHTPVVYTPQPGPLAEELLARTVPVVDDLSRVAVVPDVIHGHHTAETIQALLRFPGTPAVFVCHDWSAWHDAAPRCPLVRQYLAVDNTCRDRLVCRDGVPPERVRVLGNAVDLARFVRRAPLPAAPRRAVVFSNTATDQDVLPAIAEGCRQVGVTLDRLGGPNQVTDPETRLPEYDVVFARGRSALEAMACGAAVVLADFYGFGGLVTRDRAESLRRLNFGRRALVDTPVTAERVADALRRFDPADAAAVTDYVREVATLDEWLDQLTAIYHEIAATPSTARERESLLQLAADAVELTMPHTRLGRERWTELERERVAVEQIRRAGEAVEHRAWVQAVEAEKREQAHRAELEAVQGEATKAHQHAEGVQTEYARLHAEFTRLHADHARLQADHDSLHAEYVRLHAEYARLDAAFRTVADPSVA